MSLRTAVRSLVLAGLLAPAGLRAQAVRHELTLSAVTVTFPTPTEANYDAGLVAASTSVTFTVDSRNGPTNVLRTSIVSISATGGTMGGTKSVGDLQWRRTDLGTWTGLSTTPVMVQQRPIQRNVLNDTWSNTVLFRTLLSWASDVPATYSATIVFTLTITTP